MKGRHYERRGVMANGFSEGNGPETRLVSGTHSDGVISFG